MIRALAGSFLIWYSQIEEVGLSAQRIKGDQKGRCQGSSSYARHQLIAVPLRARPSPCPVHARPCSRPRASNSAFGGFNGRHFHVGPKSHASTVSTPTEFLNLSGSTYAGKEVDALRLAHLHLLLWLVLLWPWIGGRAADTRFRIPSQPTLASSFEVHSQTREQTRFQTDSSAFGSASPSRAIQT